MSSRRITSLALLGAVTFGAIAFEGSFATREASVVAAAQTRPNVVVILTDDLRYDDLSTLPRVRDQIAAQGATFTNFYASFPLCCPARATLFTGEYPHNHGVLSNVAPTGGFREFDDRSTLATWLTPTYRTGLIGKYFNGYSPTYTPPGWDEWMVPSSTYGYTNSRWYVRRDGQGGYRTYTGYQTDTMGSLAADFVTRNAPSTTPFFLYTSIVAPHDGSPNDPDDIAGYPSPYVKPMYRDVFKGLRNSDPSFNEADVSDKPLRPSPLSSAEITALTEVNAQRRESELSAQDATSQIIDALRASGELDNTYVIWTSDNGYLLGDHRIRGGKTQPYEVSNHLPFLLRGPGISPGTTIDFVTGQVDFAPTVLAMAGLGAPDSVDGLNLLGSARDPSQVPSRAAVVLEATDTKVDSDPLPWLYHGVVTKNWKYVARANGRKELYDLVNDPYELENVAGKSAYATIQQQMAQLTTRYQWCAGATCR